MVFAQGQTNSPLEHQSDKYKRVISAGGSITEILAAIGLADRLIAVDSSSMYPPELDSLPRVGYFRALGAEGVLALAPDLLVAARGAGPDKVLQQIANVGTDVQQFEQNIYSLDSWQLLVQEIGNFFDQTAAADKLVAKAQSSIRQTLQTRSYQPNSVNALALLSAGQRGLVAAGENTVPSLLMEIAGLNNLAKELNGFKPYSAELLATRRLDILFVPSHTVQGMGGVDGLCANKALKLAFAKDCNVIVVDPLLLLGFGARLDTAVKQVVESANQAG